MCSKKLFFCFLLILIPFSQIIFAQSTESSLARREMYLKQLLSILEPESPDAWIQSNKEFYSSTLRKKGGSPVKSKNGGPVTILDRTWKDWLKRTGELPPDFDAMPSIPFLPDPLVLDEGRKNIPITTMKQWQEKREWMKKEIMHWVTGTNPPPPDNMVAKILSEKKDGDVTSRIVELRFGPNHKAKLTLKLIIPPGEGPFPVFMTQWTHPGVLSFYWWAQIAIRRGYIACVYAGSDDNDDTEAYPEVYYPEYDFGRLMRRAWGAHRAVDYLYTLPVVDKDKIGISGSSRYAKISLLAAAFDERIGAVIMTGGGTLSNTPFRYTSNKFNVESITDLSTMFPQWLHPRMRFFVGRENKLPVDMNHFYALVAPRGLMFSTYFNEVNGNPWGTEQGYQSAKRVYQFLGAEEKLEFHSGGGNAHDSPARVIEMFVDFFDKIFGRKNISKESDIYRGHLNYNYTFSKWMGLSGEYIDPLDYPEKGLSDLLISNDGKKITTPQDFEQKKKECTERIRWGLGEEPPKQPNPGPETFADSRGGGGRSNYLLNVIGRPGVRGGAGAWDGPLDKEMGMKGVFYGDDLTGHLYYPIDSEGKIKGKNLPVVIHLHEYDYSQGFNTNGVAEFFKALIKQGFAVFAFDMINFGTRTQEGNPFYERYPHWSLLGKMVADVRSAVDAMANMDVIDSNRIYAFGYSLGGTVGLYAAALDDRIAGMASLCGFTPMRLATQDKGIEGVKAYSHLHGLSPRLGFFVGSESRIPYDFHEILASIAPRPLLVIAPQLDMDAHFPDVKACADEVDKVYELYDAKTNFTLSTPVDYSYVLERKATGGLSKRQKEVIEWLVKVSKQY